jgi:hypothetical protein
MSATPRISKGLRSSRWKASLKKAHLCDFAPTTTSVAHGLETLFLLGSPRGIGSTLLLGGRLRGGWQSSGVTLNCATRCAHLCSHHRGGAHSRRLGTLARGGLLLGLLMLLLRLLLLLMLLGRLRLLLMGNWGCRNRNAFKSRDPMEGMELLLSKKMRWGAGCGRSFDPFGSRRGPGSRCVSSSSSSAGRVVTNVRCKWCDWQYTARR